MKTPETLTGNCCKLLAEREGFEPSVTCATAVFKTAALNHSTISPDVNC